MVVPPPTSRTHHDALKDIFFPTHSHHPSVPSGVFPHLLAELHTVTPTRLHVITSDLPTVALIACLSLGMILRENGQF